MLTTGVVYCGCAVKCVVPLVSQAMEVLQVVSFIGNINIISLGSAQFWRSDFILGFINNIFYCIMPLHLATSEFLRVIMDFYSDTLDLAL